MNTIYDNLDVIVQEVLKKLSLNDSIIRLIGIDSSDALTATTVPTFNDLQFKRWFPLPTTIAPTTQSGTFLMVYYTYGTQSGSNNVYQHDAMFELYFVCHESTWVLDKNEDDKYMIRPYRLLKELRQELINMEVKEAIRGKFVVYPPTLINSSNKFIGYKMIFKLTNSAK